MILAALASIYTYITDPTDSVLCYDVWLWATSYATSVKGFADDIVAYRRIITHLLP